MTYLITVRDISLVLIEGFPRSVISDFRSNYFKNIWSISVEIKISVVASIPNSEIHQICTTLPNSVEQIGRCPCSVLLLLTNRRQWQINLFSVSNALYSNSGLIKLILYSYPLLLICFCFSEISDIFQDPDRASCSHLWFV